MSSHLAQHTAEGSWPRIWKERDRGPGILGTFSGKGLILFESVFSPVRVAVAGRRVNGSYDAYSKFSCQMISCPTLFFKN